MRNVSTWIKIFGFFAFLLSFFPLIAQAESNPYQYNQQDSDMASRLGIRSQAVAQAIEEGSQSLSYENTVSQAAVLDYKGSRFLENAYPGKEAAKRSGRQLIPRSLRELKKIRKKENAEREKQMALEKLEFRKDIEDAMKKILSFQPVRPQEQDSRYQEDLRDERDEDYQPVESRTVRDRLLVSIAQEEWQRRNLDVSSPPSRERQPARRALSSSRYDRRNGRGAQAIKTAFRSYHSPGVSEHADSRPIRYINEGEGVWGNEGGVRSMRHRNNGQEALRRGSTNILILRGFGE